MNAQNVPHESHLYHRFSCLYDVLFSPLLTPAIHSTIRNLRIPRGARVLEVGVGTGISLKAYPQHAEVTAIDSSPEMLTRAEQQVRKQNWNHVQLRTMDALDLEFDDGTFDYVLAFHILTVVNDSNRLLHEMARVAKHGATIAIVNHLRTETKWGSKLLELVNPLTRRLGWQATLSYSDVMVEAPLHVLRRFKISRASPFTVIIARQALAPAAPLPHLKRYHANTETAAN